MQPKTLTHLKEDIYTDANGRHYKITFYDPQIKEKPYPKTQSEPKKGQFLDIRV